MGASLTVLGAGSILPQVEYGCSGYALRGAPGGPVTLFDCGPGSVRRLAAVGVELGEVRRVVFSHYHPDHCLDLVALTSARKNQGFDPPHLEVIGPEGLEAVVQGVRKIWGGWVTDPDASYLEVEPAADGRVRLERDDLALEAVRTEHTPQALAWRATFPDGSSLTYTGDSCETAAVGDLARGCDLFLSECAFPEEAGVDTHLTPPGAGRLARRAGCGRLVLTHFYPDMDPARAREEAAAVFGGPVETARDGSRHPLRLPAR